MNKPKNIIASLLTKKIHQLTRSFFLFAVLLVSSYTIGVCQEYKPKSDPPPGKWEIQPDTLISGEKTKLQIRYINGDESLQPGAYHKLSIEPLSVRSLFHSRMSKGLKIVPYKRELPKVKLELEPISGVGYRMIKVIFPDGLQPNANFAIAFGNEGQDSSLTAIINPFPMKNLGFPTYSDLGNGKEVSWFKQGWLDAIPRATILSDTASKIRMFGPTLIERGEKFDIQISVTDPFDSRPAPTFDGTILLDISKKLERLPHKITFEKKDSSSVIIKDLVADKMGVYRITGTFKGGEKKFMSNPIVVKKKVGKKIYWGNLHNHGQYSEGWGMGPDNFYQTAQFSGMDFVALSDHIGINPDRGGYPGRLLRWRIGKKISSEDAWRDNLETANKYNDPGQFVSLIGYEWSSMDAGHNNVYSPHPHPHKDDIFLSEQSTYGFTMRQLLKKTDALMIPHIHAGIFPWRTMDERMLNKNGDPLTPVVEIYSDWGASFHPYAGTPEPMTKFGGLRNSNAKSALWAWEEGYKFGTIADSDSHTGLPGRRVVGGIATHHDHVAGLTAVRALSLTREELLNSYHNKRTYGTTGERIYLDVKMNSATMGEIVETENSFEMDIEAHGTDEITKIKLYRGMTLIAERTFQDKMDVEVSIKCSSPSVSGDAYVVELVQKDENRAWSTPIWIRKKTVPDLTWKKNESGLALVNQGNGKAKGVEIMYSPNEHPFTRKAIKGREYKNDEEAGILWSQVRSNQKVIVHYRWHGEPIGGELELHGVGDYEFDYNREFIFSKSRLHKIGEAKYSFRLEKYNHDFTGKGFDIILNVRPDVPSFLEFQFDRETKMIVGEEEKMGSSISIPVNGKKTKQVEIYKRVEVLNPGDRLELPALQGYWSVDPANNIAESNETNNLKLVE